jgi:hypothetical protein
MTPDARNIEYKEKLPITAGLLISEKTRQYIFRGKPESFTGGARPHEFPLGETLELASKLIFAELFEDVSLIRSLEEGQRFKLIIKPQIDDFHFRYDQLSHAGFAVSCLSRIKVTIILFSEDAKIWEKTIESPEVRKGPWMVNIEYEKEMGESASEALVYTLNQLALEIAGDESLRAHILQEKTLVAKEPQEKPELTSTPEPAPTTNATHQPQEKPKVAAIPKDVPIKRVSLRKKPIEISNQTKITVLLLEYDFFDSSRNPRGSFVNSFIDNNDGTIIDKATGLMWQKSGSTSRLNNRRAKEYIKQLNRQRFASRSDWRMPTVEELASLLAKSSKSGVHIAPIFDNKQTQCWGSDKRTEIDGTHIGGWIVSFSHGSIMPAKSATDAQTRMGYARPFNDNNYVRAVRSVK